MEESISKLVRQLVEGAPGSSERREAQAGLVAGARTIFESLLELGSSQEEDLRRVSLSALADIIMSIHQASFTARHLEPGAERPLGQSAIPEKASDGARLFGEVAIGRGLAKVEDVLRALNLQKREVLAGKQPRLIGEILVAEDVLNAEQVKTVLMEIRSMLLSGIEQHLTAAEQEEV
jgi:hypothetical protein